MRRPFHWVQPVPLLAVVLWGGIYPAAKLGLRDIPPLSFTAGRLILASLVLLAASWRPTREPRGVIGGRFWRPLLIAGLAQATFQGLLIAGLDRTTASNSAILQATAPLLTAVWVGVAGQEWLAGRQWVGLLIGLAGVALVVGAGEFSLSSRYLSGNLLELGAAAAWVWYGFAIGPVVRAVGTLRATALSMALATIILLPFALPEMAHVAWRQVSWQAWLGLVYGATAGMVVAMSLWGRSIHRLGPRETMLYTYVEPCSAVAIAALALGETLGVVQGFGAVLALAGVWLATARFAASRPTEDAPMAAIEGKGTIG